MKILTNKEYREIEEERFELKATIADLQEMLRHNGSYCKNLIIQLDKYKKELYDTKEKLKTATGRIGGLTKYINRLKGGNNE